ncbi:MAG: methyltransferase [Bacillota bacterium]
MASKLWERDLRPPQELLLLGAAVKAGLFDSLKSGPLTVQELADTTGAGYRSLRVVLEALMDAGYLTGDGDKIDLSPDAANMFYNTGSELYTGFSFMHGYELCASWLKLPEVIKTGVPVKRERSGKALKSFIQSMAVHAKKFAPVIARDIIGSPGTAPRVLDIGGGPLTYAREFASLGSSVTVLDLPDVVELMKPAIKEGEKIEMLAGDLTVGLPPGPFDLAYLGNICHIFDEDENKRLFRRVYDVLAPGGRMAIQDFVRGVSPRAAMFGVNMLVNTPGGGAWTMEQYREWITGAGFVHIEMKDYGERQLIVSQGTVL